ncbi:family 43 glycosylhydrolase [Virgibacillus phasianinus]|nr:family 43 glycosylhydrolase [Virgibacillus phasianinus]
MRILVAFVTTFIMILVLGSCNKMDETESSKSSYKNPMTLNDEWEDYGLGDPYVFKYNGMYYLYVSTRDTDVGVKVWSSANLIDWKYEGLCTEEPETKAAYAPEVIYWNGYFYMYTSPAGNGHYVLKSESPTGPFKVVTDNFGKSIDGNVFIDDDGSMYFSHAGASGIEVAPMSDPVTIGTSVKTGAYMKGWTEGSTIFKRNGKYYMTYTGNHVFSDGYRINYAVSDDPIKGYVPAKQNPIILNSEGPIVGLGHNSIVKGPNLDTDYIFYHNLEGPGVVGPLRHMNMDRIAWNGDKLTVLGPTFTEQPAPEPPEFQEYFKKKNIRSDFENSIGGKWEISTKGFLSQSKKGSADWYKQLTKKETAAGYTAEFHAKMASTNKGSNDALFGAVFSYQDEENYAVAFLNPTDNVLMTKFIEDGTESDWNKSDLPSEFDYTKLHQIRVEKAFDRFKVYVDGMLKQTIESALNGGKIGYITANAKADFGYIAFSNHVNGSAIWDIAKPVPGTIQAVHYQSGGEGIGYGGITAGNENQSYRSDPVDIRGSSEDGYYAMLNQSGEWLSYKVNIATGGTYNVDLRIATEVDGATLKIMQGNHDVSGEISLPNTKGAQNWKTVTIKGLELSKGKKDLKVELMQGEASISTMTFYEDANVNELRDTFTEGMELEWTMYESYWTVDEGFFAPSNSTFSKAMTGKDGWTNYTVAADIQLNKAEGDAGILVNGVNPANGMELNQRNGDFLQGYYAFIKPDGVYLGKQNYKWELLTSVPMELSIDDVHHMKVEVDGANVKVFVENMEKPIIDYEDISQQPFTHGKAGLRVHNNAGSFDNFVVTPD